MPARAAIRATKPTLARKWRTIERTHRRQSCENRVKLLEFVGLGQIRPFYRSNYGREKSDRLHDSWARRAANQGEQVECLPPSSGQLPPLGGGSGCTAGGPESRSLRLYAVENVSHSRQSDESSTACQGVPQGGPKRGGRAAEFG